MTTCNFGLTEPSLKDWVYVLHSDDFVMAGTGKHVLANAATRILGNANGSGQWVTLAAANVNVEYPLEFEEASDGECIPVLMPSGKSPTQVPGALYIGRELRVPVSWKNLNMSSLKWTGEKLAWGDPKIKPRTPPDPFQIDTWSESDSPDSSGKQFNYDIDPKILSIPFDESQCGIWYGFGAKGKSTGLPPIDVEPQAQVIFDQMKASGYAPNLDTIQRYLECAKAGYDGANIPTGTPTEPTQSDKASVWPYVALGAAGLLAVVLVAKAK